MPNIISALRLSQDDHPDPDPYYGTENMNLDCTSYPLNKTLIGQVQRGQDLLTPTS